MIGQQSSVGNINSTLSQLAIQWRDLASLTIQQAQYINNLGPTGLQALGFSAPDAASVVQMIDYMLTCAQVYKGQVQQGGSGGTGAILFNFDNALTGLWGGD